MFQVKMTSWKRQITRSTQRLFYCVENVITGIVVNVRKMRWMDMWMAVILRNGFVKVVVKEEVGMGVLTTTHLRGYVDQLG